MIPTSQWQPWQLVWLQLLAASGVATLGALAAIVFRRISHLWLCLLISFAAGALLAVAVFDIFPEVSQLVGVGRAIVSYLTGYALFFLITKFVFHICPACAATHTEVNFRAITLSMIVALSIHSFMDGLAVYSGTRTGSPAGLLVLLAVVYHKFPEGLALTLVAIGSGLPRSRAFLLTLLIESLTTISGGVAGMLMMIPVASPWLGYVLGHIGGGFAFLVIHALLGETFKHHPLTTLVAVAAGAGSIWITARCIGL